MNKTNFEIKNNFTLFEKLRDEEKIIVDEEIILNPKMSNANWEECISEVQHRISSANVKFIVEQWKKDSIRYGVKLKCENLSKSPYFRFDSDGPAHRNTDNNIPLEEQSVTTPHFNSFDINGKSIAYKNEVLKNEDESKTIQQDINFGIALFCRESNSKLQNDNYPTVKRQNLLLDLPDVEMMSVFLLDNINFE